ncbi:hypothetical protein [Actibacterium sp. XHP0104]|uniref:hypothetical protein n=1 Tax=Actibacterium sp. XHP0104 TaxID=2984335 RepID=UPI0021E9469B|nr:hypothetical protein [Actibacterium sp. XHP0104]MCV2881405.1 hypothetical protein [Actibacterium sp. XHP0104]
MQKGNMMRAAGLVLIVAMLAGCADFPQVDAAMRDTGTTGPYPELIPIEHVMGDLHDPRLDEDSGSDLQRRAAGLRARAAALRKISPE